jgi:hypothetical protein
VKLQKNLTEHSNLNAEEIKQIFYVLVGVKVFFHLQAFGFSQ